MKPVRWKSLLVLLAVLGLGLPAQAHVGSKDIFEQVSAGPYQLFVTIRPPNVIPGVAVIEARASGVSGNSPVTAIRITPTPLTGEAANHPPSPDAMERSADDPAFFTGSLWLMAPGSWQVRFEVDGAAGKASTSVPVPAMPLSILPMDKPLGTLLGALGALLVLGIAAIVAAAVRESRLAPGLAAPEQPRTALTAGAATLLLAAGAVALGGWWWNAEASGYARAIYHPLRLSPSLSGNTLDLKISSEDETRDKDRRRAASLRSNADLLPDHGHLMHLYAIRQPGMDAVFHLHPAPATAGDLRMTLPSMPPGVYALYGDIVHANGFPETLTATLTIPPTLPPSALAADDASALPPPLDHGDLGPSYSLPDGYTMVWERPAALTASTAYAFRFHLLDPAGKPATDMQPYLGMAGHAAFVKADGTTFAHTHPNGSAAMAAVELANGASPTEMDTGSMSGMDMTAQPTAPTVEFPYGFPSPGRYRVCIQMKHGHTVETGVFDAEVHP
ncbi:MAG TPA: hypothetical protein VNW54_10075 [Granulicella sp.]|nr:hypothetical protein [Granulicella sp.]